MGACSSTPSRSAPSTGRRAARQLPRPDRRARRRRDTAPHPARRRRPERGGAAGGGRGLELQVKRLDSPLRPRAGLRPPLRRQPRRLLARQQQGRRARPLLVHGRRRRAARLDDHLRRRRAASVTVDRGGRDEVLRGVDLRLPQPRDAAAALPLRRPPVRLQLRLRRLLRLRAEGRLRGQRRAPLVDAGRGLRLRRPDDRLRPPRGVHLRALRDRAAARPRRPSAGSPRRACGSPRCRRSTSPSGARSRPSASRSSSSLSRSHQQYLDDIAECKRHLIEGETLRDLPDQQDHRRGRPDPLPLYRTLRRVNPAPFSAYLRFGEAAVLSSSPERFLCDRPRPLGRGEADQGHRAGAARTPAEDVRLAEELRTDEKTRAENLMISRPAAQRPRRRLRDRHRARAAPDARRDLRDRAPAGLDRARPAARGASSRPTASAPASPAAR